MKKIAALLVTFLSVSFSITYQGCKKPSNSSDGFDRAAMLRNYAENLIIPAYTELDASLEGLKLAIQTFESQKDSASLVQARQKWVETYTKWQFANAYNFGPAGEQGTKKSLAQEIGTWPVSEVKLTEIISTGIFNLNDFNRDARGLLAIEYLLYSSPTASISEMMDLFYFQPNRMLYLNACINDVNNRVSAVLSAWNNGYKEEFIENDGSDAGSSTSMLYNEFVKSFEANKNFKLELPMGLRPGQTQQEPHLVEAFYSGLSTQFLQSHLQAIGLIYHGNSQSGNDGIGFKEYVLSVTGGEDLSANTLAQWQKVTEAASMIPSNPSLSFLIINQNPSIENLRTELQKHTRFFKSDMSSVLGIAITYSSGDGD